MSCLHDLGYITICPMWKAIGHHAYNKPIATVTTLTNSIRTIDVVESTTQSSISPIFQFHLMVVMNYISAISFFSSYPMLMSQRQSLINHIRYKNNLPSTALVACYSKYQSQGFELSTTSIGWAEVDGKVHRSMPALL